MKAGEKKSDKTKEETESSLLRKLLRRYDSNDLPNNTSPVNVTLGMSLQNIISFDTENNIITVNAWLHMVGYIVIM